ncbi:hypothetical protein B0J11DRAFT_81372 [Dendryphion nanum]|uniref:Transmembrane protein n=1 Tax=Dendryphion nanum TaxID=256645 RepID=A0A9P9IGB1_9PLEO|nr:hypothetical protein B0J11DRAFT_81372 [Dendryphion nanum]
MALQSPIFPTHHKILDFSQKSNNKPRPGFFFGCITGVPLCLSLSMGVSLFFRIWPREFCVCIRICFFLDEIFSSPQHHQMIFFYYFLQTTFVFLLVHGNDVYFGCVGV